jgi:hypothetical protein
MALTRVSPALFQVSNNITSVTVGGSANTISLTFDSNGVITGASNNAVSVANTAITGNIISSQITSVANTQISGNITAAQITSVANTQLTGLIQAAQIGSANATLITSGTLPVARFPAKTVKQVVYANYTPGNISTGTTGSFVSSGIAALSITPTSASSVIVIGYFNIGGHRNNLGSTNNYGSYYTIFRDIAGGGYSNLGNATYGITSNIASIVNLAQDQIPITMVIIDSPATTSTVNYIPYFKIYNTAGYFNHDGYGAGGTTFVGIAMEISV